MTQSVTGCIPTQSVGTIDRARVLTLAAQDLCTEHQSYLNWASLQLAETGLALVEASIEGLQADSSAQ